MKKPLSKKKKLLLIIAACLVVVLLATGLTVYFTVFYKKGGTHRAQIDVERPPYENVLLKRNEYEKAYAIYLYETACKAFKDCQACASIDDYASTTDIGGDGIITVTCQGCRYTVKNGTEYYYADYSGLENPKQESLISISSKVEDTLFAIRSYTDISTMDYMYTEKSLRPSVVISDGEIEIEADWSEENRVEGFPTHEAIPVFHKLQQGVFEQTEMVISAETVLEASVQYDENDGYYTVKFVLDVNNPETTKNTIENLRAGLSGANYSSITKTYEIWDNGYFRSCESIDKADNGGLFLTLDFKTYFKYSEEDCNASTYQYFDEVKQHALAENK